jgi:hypothetical protein
MASVLAVIACHAAFRHRAATAVAAWAIAALLLTGAALLRPRLFALPHRAWLRIGALLGAVVSPVVLGTLYFVLLAPIGLLARLRGRDELRLKRPPAGSLWRLREPAGPAPESLKHQF